MNKYYPESWLLTGSILYALCCYPVANAQVVQDRSLPAAERSQVSGNPNFQIDGGARRGSNLFHSFSRFSVPTGGSAYFNNAPGIQNIFSRVTGRASSTIDGLIRANGSANLFLLNPNGIIFGPNARLNIGGSFVGSTANSINFADGSLFSAKAPQANSLLTVSVPVGLQFGPSPGDITVRGNGYNLSAPIPFASPLTREASSTGLQVVSGKTLALVGGDVKLIGGVLTAEQGRLELGSVRSGVVNLSSIASGLALSYASVPSFGDIRLSGRALVDASGSPGGSIHVKGERISLLDGSILLIQNQSNQRAGSLNVNAISAVELSGNSPDLNFPGGLRSDALGGGSGANITVSTQQFSAKDGAGIFATSFSSGRSGNVTVSASDQVRLIGLSPIRPTVQTLISVVAYGSGDGGDILVSTRRLNIEDGAYIGSLTSLSSRGGDITVNASESIETTGASNITISNVSAGTNGTGRAGDVTVNTARLVAQDGGGISTSAGSSGDAGKLTVNATESVEVQGQALLLIPFPSNISSYAFVYPFPGQPIPSGASGDVIINTPRLKVSNGASINVSHQGTGDAGTLRINADSILLDRQGAITASTASGEGGNIDLGVGSLLLTRRNGQITTSAGGSGNGGNINIDSALLFAIDTENSDIRADSVNARGGNVTISTDGLFGLQFREQNSLLSDITATGASSALNGRVEIITPEVNPTSGLVELPTGLVDASGLIAQGCAASEGNSFTITGRGGLPPTPQEALADDPPWQDQRNLGVIHRPQNAAVTSATPSAATHPASGATPALVEATGWTIGAKGEVTLTAAVPRLSFQAQLQPPLACRGT
ncbi:S-layer family protein [Leptolyngbya sp. FACHB-261]|uniref:beta strand repeat-containing protein n=1 Tax=Leptolyngbya sp. FACHB-261 TaxID=2692806 RepID=UPI00168852D0|nr:S-layer family protein [Leptolyngbya sp. FACHB-261]MBD2103928.1 S-layer family protein [Leptolyngbya sp. FACHB-261]